MQRSEKSDEVVICMLDPLAERVERVKAFERVGLL